MAETVACKYRAFISYSHADTAWAKWLHRMLGHFRIDKDLVGRMLRVSAPILAGALALIFATNASAAPCDPPCAVGELCFQLEQEEDEEQAVSFCVPCDKLLNPSTPGVRVCPDFSMELLPNCPCDREEERYSDESIRTFKGHSGYVISVAFSPDGRTVLSGSWDTTLKLWDVATGKELRTFKGHSDDIWSVALSPDGRTALSGGADKTLRLWDVATGEELRTFKGHTDTVLSVAFSPDGRTALSGSFNHELKLWDVATGKEIRSFTGAPVRTDSIAFGPDGHAALTGGSASKDESLALKLWDVATGKGIRTFPVQDDVTSVAFSPDGRLALSAGNWVKLWDVPTGRKIRTFPTLGRGGGDEYPVAFSPDGRTALSDLKLWDVATGKELHTFKGGTAPSVAFSPDGRTAISAGGFDNTLQLWDVETWVGDQRQE